MRQGFMKGILDNFVWGRAKQYRPIFLDAKNAEYEFNLYLDDGMLTFACRDVEIFEDRVVFRNETRMHSVPYRRMQKPQPLLSDQKLDVVVRRPMQPVYILIPLLLFVLSGVASNLAVTHTRDQRLNDWVAPPSKLSEIAYYFYTFDEYAFVPDDAMTNIVQEALTSQSLRWAAGVLLFVGIALVAWTYILFLSTDKLDRRIILLQDTRLLGDRAEQAQGQTAAQPEGKPRMELFFDILKSLAWPIIVTALILMFNVPIREIVGMLPEKVKYSTEGGIGGVLSYKIQEAAIASGNAELATIINGLSEEEIKYLIRLGGTAAYTLVGRGSSAPGGVPENYFLSLPDLEIWKQLVERGLAQTEENLDEFETFVYSLEPEKESNGILRFQASALTQQQKARLLDNSVEVTDSGKRAYDIIIQVITGLIGKE